MDIEEQIKSQIRSAFGNVEFPNHCGWNAAIAKDSWVSDPDELLRITNIKDVKGSWWEVPFGSLANCSMAQCYLDARGVEFYLPAFMTGVIDNPIRKNYSSLISWLTPRENDEECNLYDYFCEKFALIDLPRKRVCIRVLKYIEENLEPTDPFSQEEIENILSHEFWRV